MTEAQILAVLAEASGGPIARFIPTFDHRTGRVHFPAWRTPVPAKRTRAQNEKRKAKRKQVKASRRQGRR